MNGTCLKDVGMSAGDFPEQLHYMLRCMIPEKTFDKFYLRLWACPGIVEFVLRDPMISPSLHEKQHSKIPGGFHTAWETFFSRPKDLPFTAFIGALSKRKLHEK